MKVKFVKIDLQFVGEDNSLTLGKEYEVKLMTGWGSVHIRDDEGHYSMLAHGEYEVVKDEELDE